MDIIPHVSSPSSFTLDDFIAQMNQVQKLGPMSKLMTVIPGMCDMLDQVIMTQDDLAGDLARMRAMYNSMTPAERADPASITAPRRHRIARGAGVPVAAVSKFLLDFDQSRAIMAAVGHTGVTGRILRPRDTISPKLTLGLVTHHRHHRDPSHVHKDPRPRHPALAAFLLAVALTLATAALLFTFLNAARR